MAHPLVRRPGDEDAARAPAPDPDELGGRQQAQRLAQRRPADPELVGELLLGAEAVVLLASGLDDGSLRFLRKQTMQLASKLRYASAQLTALLEDRLWVRTAGHANAMAARLATAVADVPGVRVTHPVQANAVFAILPIEATARLQETWPFYVWDERTGEVRWMCAWDTTEEDVDAFAADVARACA